MGVIVEAVVPSYHPHTIMSITPIIQDRYVFATSGERTGGVYQFVTIHDLDDLTYKVFTIRAPGGLTLNDGGPNSRQFQEYGGACWIAYLYGSNSIGATAIYPDGSYDSYALSGYTPYWGNGGSVIAGRLLVNSWTGSYYRFLSYDMTDLSAPPNDLGRAGPGSGYGGWDAVGFDGTNCYVAYGTWVRKWTNVNTGAYTDYNVGKALVSNGWWDSTSGVIGWFTSDSYLAFMDVASMTMAYVSCPYPTSSASLTRDALGVWHWVGNNTVYAYDPSDGSFHSAAVAFPIGNVVSAWPYGNLMAAISG